RCVRLPVPVPPDARTSDRRQAAPARRVERHAIVSQPAESPSVPFRAELVLTLGRSVGFAVTFFIPVVLVRVFDQATFGTYKQLFLVFATLYYITQVGMAESLFYFVPQAQGRRGAYVANAAVGFGALGLASGTLLWAAAPAIAVWLNNAALAANLHWIG